MDNFYNSVRLAELLYAKKFHGCGTLRLATGGAPPVLRALGKVKHLVDTKIFRRRGDVFIILWQDTCLVKIITTIHNASTEVPVVERWVKKKRWSVTTFSTRIANKPIAITEYIKFMGGVDLYDQMTSYYHFTCQTLQWSKKMLYHLLQLWPSKMHTWCIRSKPLTLKSWSSCGFIMLDVCILLLP